MARLYLILLSFIITCIFTGCFTGIESTPMITADDVKREQVAVSAEQQLLVDINAEPFGIWLPGKEFYVTDDKIALIFGATYQGHEKLAGTIITYRGNKQVISVTGTNVTELIFQSSSGGEYVYRIDSSAEELSARDQLDIPFTIERSLVNAVKNKLNGKKLYILTSVWYDDNDAITSGQKFIPVTITDVSAGNIVYPIKLTFADLSGNPHQLFMSVGRHINKTRMFHSLFSFNDPHEKYPNITDETWQNIINGRVVPDMTRDECRLSLGAPKTIDRRPGYGGVQELWIYEDGKYLMFEDGLLRNFRK